MSAVEPLDEDAFSAQAEAAGRVDRARRAAVLGRAEPPRRDPEQYEVRPTAATVAMLEAVIDADPGLVDFVDDQVAAAQAYAAEAAGRPVQRGRAPELSTRTGLIAFLMLAHKEPNFHVLNLPGLLGALPADARRRLGIDRLVKVPNTGLAGTDADFEPAQVTYRQLLTCFHRIANAFDPTLEGLDDDERVRRASAQQELVRRAVNAPRLALLPDWVPDPSLAGDATMKWAWERPPGRQGKIPRRGSDGDAGPPKALSEIVGPDGDLAAAGFDTDEGDPDGAPVDGEELAEGAEADAEAEAGADVGDDGPAGGAVPGVNRRTRRALRRRQLRRSAAVWVGRRDMADSIYGYALHTLVNGGDGPCVITHLALTPATANPAGTLLPLIRDLHDTRAATHPDLRPVGDVTADGAYTGSVKWQLGLRAMGGSPIFRLHPTTQEGRRQVGRFTFLNGRPICECCPVELDEPWPAFRNRPTRAEIAAHQRLAAQRRRWEWKANGPAKPSGSRQFLAPHRGAGPDGGRGGCEHCVHADGTPVLDAHGLPKPRCCAQSTKTFSAIELALFQDETFGTREWYDRWNVRDRVEGTYGVMRHLALTNYSRDYHHFVGQGPESLVATFAAMAHNMHMIAGWFARQAAELERDDARSGGAVLPMPPHTPTETFPPPASPAALEAEPKRRSGPKGLAELGDDPPDS